MLSLVIFNQESFGATDKKAPTVKISSPLTGSQIPAGNILIQGTSSDIGSGVRTVQVRVDNGAFTDSTPKGPNDWSEWSATKNILTIGDHKIEAKAIDYAGNSKTTFIKISILVPTAELDTISPQITAPADIIQEAQGQLTPVSLGTPLVSDNKDPSPIITNNSPSQFPLGLTIVTWTATDSSGNSASANQSVMIKDTTSPTVTTPSDIVLESDSKTIKISLANPVATDIVDSSLDYANDAPLEFPIGVTVVTWNISDDSGNTSTTSQKVIVNEVMLDSFGVKKLYQSNFDGPSWSMATDVLSDQSFTTIPPPSSTCTNFSSCTLLYKSLTNNKWNIMRKDVPQNEGVRMVVKSPSDKLWLNTEMTGYYHLKSSIYYPQEFIHVIRSGTPHSSTCQGYSYYAGITFDGDKAKIQKSLYHGADGKGYSQTFYVGGTTVPLNERWIGLKTVTYNVNSQVKTEIWLDNLADNNWIKVYEQTDNGWSVPGDPGSFGCINPLTGDLRKNNDVILWGGTEQQFRADNSEFEFDDLSIREIIPPQN